MSSITYAQALNDAKQMIVQQQLRIKADAEKIRAQQQMIVDHTATIAESDRRLREQSAELQRMVDDSASLGNRCQELTTAKEQAEAIIDRQGNRLTQMQTQISEMEQTISEQATTIESLTQELATIREQLPTSADQEALSAMADLLAKRPASMAARKSPSPMRIAEDDGGMPMSQAA